SLMHKEPAQTVRDPASSAANRSPDREAKDFDGEGFARRAAQARHTRSPKVRNPDIDLALRHAERSRDFGTGPSIHENALDDERSPRRCHCAMRCISIVHAPLTRVAAE